MLIGGKRLTEGALARGFFVTPTVFDQCRDDMAIVREEIFGPVMMVLDFDDEEEAIGRANDTHFGLSAGVFTQDLNRAHRVIGRLQAGSCWINHYNMDGFLREVRISLRYQKGGLHDLKWSYIVADIHNLGFRKNAQDHAFHYAGIVVSKAEISG